MSLKTGDIVKVTNGFKVVLPGLRTIIEKDTCDNQAGKSIKWYFIEPTDTPWFSFPENRLEKI